jgi:hypothetical protein
MTSSLDRQAPCPSCGAPITFKFAGARAEVCKYCKAVCARTDRGLHAQGRMADLLEIPTPLQLGVTGKWRDEPFEVLGRVQMDRAGAPGAPWQEINVWFPRTDATTWVAYAQGRWYATNEVPPPPQGLPMATQLSVGMQLDFGQYGVFVVQEVGQRRVVSGEGSLASVPAPGAVTFYADVSGPGGQFGTIDFRDEHSPVLFLGRQFDPRELQLDSGVPLEAPQAQVKEAACPSCGGSLPIVSQQSERVVCRFCGTASDIRQGTLAALGPAPRPPIEPLIPIGAEGTLRGARAIVCGFVIRSCSVEGERFSWREYLVYLPDTQSYQWLMEEDGRWQHVMPLEAGDVLDSGGTVGFRGQAYGFKQQVDATVDYVIGEFYWKVEIGESVEAAEFEGPGGKVSRETTRSATGGEINYSFCAPLDASELAAFGVTAPPAPAAAAGGGCGAIGVTIVVVVVICLVLALMLGSCDDCGGGGGGGFVGGGSGFGK